MCGRFVSSANAADLASYFGAIQVDELLLEARYNVAPTDDVFVVVAEPTGERRLDAFRWGLVPWWATDPKVGSRMINARAETLAGRSAFREPFERRRCLVPADGFYEWQRFEGRKDKQAWFLHPPTAEPFAFAGLWSSWRGPDGATLRSCSIVTCAANATMAALHDRMPVILPTAAWDEWLDPDGHDVAALERLLVPAPEPAVVAQAVGPAVNSVRNDGPHLLDPVTPETNVLWDRSLFDQDSGSEIS